MMKNLLLTLGHNSSAILIEDNQVKWGYETERLTGNKSDSGDPIAALMARGIACAPDMAYVTHWQPDGLLSNVKSKYLDVARLDGVPIRTLSADCSHHDTHIAGAVLYAGKSFAAQDGAVGLVIDGFGTFGEHLSVYRFDAGGKPKLMVRYRGYDTSLGLFYQYATAFMGMKMHEDEYKLLGYEVHVDPRMASDLQARARHASEQWLDQFQERTSIYGSMYDPLYNVDALQAVRESVYSQLTEVCRSFNIQDPSSFEGRAALAFYVQAVLENVVLAIVRTHGARHLLCSGGVFYNVKLNRVLLRAIDGSICVYPLAGDQGNALGLYAMDHPEFEMPANLNWGRRRLESPGHVPGMYFMKEDEEAYGFILTMLHKRGYVNVVRGNMEFGPRALCNTSTLAVPTMENVQRINKANGRNTVMPMAPVMVRSQYDELFFDTHRVHKSEEHMIVSLEYKYAPTSYLRGAAHFYQRPYSHWTGRPQVIADSDPLSAIIKEYKHPLINTSFNFHGKPIAFDVGSVYDNHMAQWRNDPSFTTVVLENV
jgi:carbamoyltransferase